jgi:hypothetical protein
MPTVEISTTRPNAQGHVEVALSLAQGAQSNITVPTLQSVAAPIKPVNWPEFTDDWLDTPADHCSPLDDY